MQLGKPAGSVLFAAAFVILASGCGGATEIEIETEAKTKTKTKTSDIVKQEVQERHIGDSNSDSGSDKSDRFARQQSNKSAQDPRLGLEETNTKDKSRRAPGAISPGKLDTARLSGE